MSPVVLQSITSPASPSSTSDEPSTPLLSFDFEPPSVTPPSPSSIPPPPSSTRPLPSSTPPPSSSTPLPPSTAFLSSTFVEPLPPPVAHLSSISSKISILCVCFFVSQASYKL